MALVDSNTYVEPTAGTSLNNSRTNFNTSLRSLITNFKSTAIPGPTNIVIAGANAGEQDGMLYRSATTNALYISDSVHVKSSPVGGNFTRVGIGNRVENGIAALTANVATYEIGELVATVSASGALSSNARLYLNVANNGTMADFIDVGIPPTNGSVTNTMLATTSITADRIKNGNVLLSKVDFTTGTGDGASGAAATLKLSSAAGNDTSLGFGTRNAANVALVWIDSATGHTAGLNLYDQTNAYAPMASNLALQSAIQGGTTAPVPIVPAGSVIAWSGSSAPSGWVLCDGTAISRTTYAALFAIAGTSYGIGDGSTTFNVPDLRDRLPLGKGTNNSTLGTQTGSMDASSVITTSSSGSGGLTLTTASRNDTLGSGTKDVTQITLVTDVSQAAHTHTVTVPTSVVNYIIKT
ncbi:MAG: phage tail protein [Pelagibacteraceae bacterium]